MSDVCHLVPLPIRALAAALVCVAPLRVATPHTSIGRVGLGGAAPAATAARGAVASAETSRALF